jgi:hypothetical protein
MKLVVKKGYTLTCTSWENDADNYRTKSITVQDKEEAKAIKELCDIIFKSENNGDGGIGNSFSLENDHKEMIVEFMKERPALCDGSTDDDELFDKCMKYNYQLMGSSEDFDSRISESCVVTYSDKDIEVVEVNFNN